VVMLKINGSLIIILRRGGPWPPARTQ
jgi:hypothetical protein